MIKNNLSFLLQERFSSVPEKKAYIFLDSKGKEEILTWSDLYQRSKKMANVLQQTTHKDEILVLSLQPSLDFIVMVFSCLLAKRIFMPLYPIRSQHDVVRTQSILKNIPLYTLITDNPLSQENKSLFAGPAVTLPELFSKTLEKTEEFSPDYSDYSEDRLVFLQPSSGTTRAPKAIMISHNALVSCLKNMQEALCLSPNDRGFSWLPPYHDMGLIGGIFLPFFVNFPVYLMRPSSFILNPLKWLYHLTKYQITVTAAPNIAYELCCSRYQQKSSCDLDLSHLRLAINSAEMIKPKTLKRFYQTFKHTGLKWESIIPAYGLAETTLMVTLNPLTEGPKIIDFNRSDLEEGIANPSCQEEEEKVTLVSSGKPIPSMQCIIVDRETGFLRKPFEIGEIWVKGNSLAQGYLEDGKNTLQSFCITENFDDAPVRYVRTGDSGFIDDQGYLFVTGRIKDSIKTAQRVISAEEVEDAVDEILPFDPLYASAALPLFAQDKTELIIVKETPKCDEYVNYAQQIREHLHKHLSLRVNTVLFVPQGQIPRTTSGKIKRHTTIVLFKYDLLETLGRCSFPT